MTEETTAVQVAQPKAVEVHDSSEFANLLDSSKFGQLQRVASIFAASQLVPAHYQNNLPNCFIALQMSMRLGTDPFMFMQNTHVVHGRPGMEAKLAIALINSSGLFKDSLDYEIEGGEDASKDGYRVRCFATRASTGKVVYGPWIDWSIVKKERWDSKDGSKWKTIPALMFQYRAATWFGRLHCPERLMGMQTRDEVEDVAPLEVEAEVVATRDDLNERLSKFQQPPALLAATPEPEAAPKPKPTKPAQKQPKADPPTAPMKRCQQCGDEFNYAGEIVDTPDGKSVELCSTPCADEYRKTLPE